MLLHLRLPLSLAWTGSWDPTNDESSSEKDEEADTIVQKVCEVEGNERLGKKGIRRMRKQRIVLLKMMRHVYS